MPDTGRAASEVWDEEAMIVEDDSTEGGGHAGGGVASIEEIHRPGTHYIITKSGPQYHGKTFAPESTPHGAVHVTLLEGKSVRINEGTMTPLLQHHLSMLQKELKRR